MHPIKKLLNNRSGIILALLAIFFAVVGIFTASVLSIVYSDTKFSINDENRSKAYYAARSAVATVEQGINIELKDLKDKETALIAARDAFETTKSNENFEAYMSARADYNVQYNYIQDNVLGNQIHIVKIEGLETDSSTDEYTVAVEPYLSGYRLESTASVQGTSSTVAKYFGSNLSIGVKINVTRHTLLENSLYAVNGITVGNNGDIYSEIFGGGDVSYWADSGTNPEFSMHDGAEIIARVNQDVLPSPYELLTTSPYDYLPVASAAGVFTANTVISADARYSSITQWSGDYTIDTSGGDIILQFENVNLDGDFSFQVKGDNALIIYVTGAFSKTRENAQLNMIFRPENLSTDDAEIYFMIEESGTSNIFDVKNNFIANNFYLYAPYSDLHFKNNFGGQGPSGLMEGAIVGQNIDLKSNADVKYVKPSKFNIGIGDASIGTDATSQQLYNIDNIMVGYWLKD